MQLAQQLAAAYQEVWDGMICNPARADELAHVCGIIVGNRSRYEFVSGKTSVPWWIIGIIHYREADFDFTTHLHNGDPLSARTVDDPAGRPKFGQPPFTWEESAQDALNYDNLDIITDWSVAGTAFALEKYNGFGYRGHGINSPYLWAGGIKVVDGTFDLKAIYEAGKYGSDGEYNPNLADEQLGGMVILESLCATGTVALAAETV